MQETNKQKKIVILGMIIVFLLTCLLCAIGILFNINAEQTKEIRELQKKVERIEKAY